jgi:hypothetical protein
MAGVLAFVIAAIVTAILGGTHTVTAWWALLIIFVLIWLVLWWLFRCLGGEACLACGDCDCDDCGACDCDGCDGCDGCDVGGD